jgi:hypothetical protein
MKKHVICQRASVAGVVLVGSKTDRKCSKCSAVVIVSPGSFKLLDDPDFTPLCLNCWMEMKDKMVCGGMADADEMRRGLAGEGVIPNPYLRRN